MVLFVHVALILLIPIISNGVVSKIVPVEDKLLPPIFTNVATENGLVHGRFAKTAVQGRPYIAFQGIPYAQPPVGELRFQAPQPAKNWSRILFTTRDPPECVQGFDPVVGSEDCLYLNVYTPSYFQRNRYSVMVWIYGGGFINGNSNYSSYAPDYFLDEGVIVVTLNYRLGVFGFLSTGDLIVPGNNGLKDQVLALKWVQRNIAHFGGDPNNVTIFGESAGAASVSYQLQSKLSKGLYRAAIMQSGNSLCLWSLSRQTKTVRTQLAAVYNLNPFNSRTFVDGLRKINYVDLQQVSTFIYTVILFEETPLNGLPIGPVNEPEHEGAFFTGKSHQLLNEGHFNQVPSIIGFNSFELNLEISFPIRLYITRLQADQAELVPVDMNINRTLKSTVVGPKIKRFYFGNVPVNEANSDSIRQYLSDNQFNRPTREIVRLQSKTSPVYYYKFSHRGVLGGNQNSSTPGVGHAAELPYFWYNPNINGSSADYTTVHRVVKLWTNFAKFRNPTPTPDPILNNITWEKAEEKNGLSLLDIDNNLDTEGSSTKYLEFWQDLYRDYGRPPYDTY